MTATWCWGAGGSSDSQHDSRPLHQLPHGLGLCARLATDRRSNASTVQRPHFEAFGGRGYGPAQPTAVLPDVVKTGAHAFPQNLRSSPQTGLAPSFTHGITTRFGLSHSFEYLV